MPSEDYFGKKLEESFGLNPVKAGSTEDSLRKIVLELTKIRILLEGKAE